MVSDGNRRGQFKKGETGNPAGRPKGYERQLREVIDSMTAADPLLADDPSGSPESPKIPAWQAIVKRAVLDAIDGDRYARDFVADRLMGKPKQTVNIDEGAEPSSEIDWSVVPVEKRKQLLETLILVAPTDPKDAIEH